MVNAEKMFGYVCVVRSAKAARVTTVASLNDVSMGSISVIGVNRKIDKKS